MEERRTERHNHPVDSRYSAFPCGKSCFVVHLFCTKARSWLASGLQLRCTLRIDKEFQRVIRRWVKSIRSCALAYVPQSLGGSPSRAFVTTPYCSDAQQGWVAPGQSCRL